MDMRRISEIIESNNKEQQNTINFLQESIAHYRDNLDKMEKQLSTVQFVAKSTEEKMQEAMDEIVMELDEAQNKMLDQTNKYEDKISRLET